MASNDNSGSGRDKVRARFKRIDHMHDYGDDMPMRHVYPTEEWHETSRLDWCWCQPKCVVYDDGVLIVHRRALKCN